MELLQRFDSDIHSHDLAGMAARAAVVVLLDNWKDSDDSYPGDVDDVILLLVQWKAIVTSKKEWNYDPA